MADTPRKTRAEREEELQSLWKGPDGRARVSDLYREVTGDQAATIPSAAAVVFMTILDKEFPIG